MGAFDRFFDDVIRPASGTGDVLVVFTTSGNSPNVLEGLRAASQRGLYTIGLTGESGGQMGALVETLFCVPSTHTPRIQETHLMIGHVLCELVDRLLVPGLYLQD